MKKLTFTAALFALPLIASAQTLQPLMTLMDAIGRLVAMLIPILITVALIVFFFGLIKYIRSSGKGHAEGKNIMIAGLVSLFVMVWCGALSPWRKARLECLQTLRYKARAYLTTTVAPIRSPPHVARCHRGCIN